jgi:hypothetical protein
MRQTVPVSSQIYANYSHVIARPDKSGFQVEGVVISVDGFFRFRAVGQGRTQSVPQFGILKNTHSTRGKVKVKRLRHILLRARS